MANLNKIKHTRDFQCFHTLLKIFFVFFFFSTIVQNGVNSQLPDTVAKALDSLEQTSLWSDTLRGLFELTDTYVDLISKNKFGPSVLKGLGMDFNNFKLSQFNNLQIPDIQQTLKTIAKDTAVYITHFAIGIFIFVALIVCVFALCCCRSKACFCGKTGKQIKKSSDKNVIVVMFIFILILTVVIFLDGFGLAVGTKVFTDNFEIKNETGNTQVMNRALTIIDNTVEYVNSLKNETVDLLDKFLKERADKIIANITSTTFVELIGTDGNLNISFFELNEGLIKSKTNLDQMIEVLTNLTKLYGDAGNSIMKLDDIENLKEQIDGILEGDFRKAISQDGPEEILNEFSKKLGNSTQLVEFFLNHVKELFPTDLQISKEIMTSNNIFITVNQLLNKISPILTIIGYIVASFIFFMVVMNLVGLLLVILCGSAKPSIPEKIFIVSGGTYFPIGGIFALLAAILFIATCPLYGEFCRDFSRGKESTYFGIADNAIEKNLIDWIDGTNILEGVNLTLNYSELNLIRSGLYGNCQNNQSLVNVLLRLATIDKDLTDSLVTKFVVPFINSSFPSNTEFDIFNDGTFQTINDSIDFISSFNLSAFDQFTGAETAETDEQIDTDFPAIDSLAKQIQETKSELMRLVGSLKENLQSVFQEKLPVFRDKLKVLQNKFKIEGGLIPAIKASVLTAIKSTTFDNVKELEATLKTSFFCKPMFDLFQHFLSIPCNSLLRPLNAIWLTLGVFPILIIPSVGFGLFLGGLLFRQKKKKNLVTDYNKI